MNYLIDICSGDCENAKSLINRNWDWEPNLYPRHSGFGHHRVGDPDFYRIEFQSERRRQKAEAALEDAGIDCFSV